MRIAYFTDTYLPEVNGVVTSLDAHARELASRGHEILIVCPKYKRPILHVIPHVQIRRYRSFSFVTNKETRLALPSFFSVARLLRRFRPDVVHIQTPLSIGVVGLVTAKMLRLPTLQTYHTYIPDFMQYVELHRLLRLDDLQDRIVNSLIFERMFEAGEWQLLDRFPDNRRRIERVRDVARSVLGTLTPDERPEISTRVAWQYTRTLYNPVDLVITPSMALKRELESHGVTVPVAHLSNGIDMGLITPKGSYAPTGRLLHAGRLGHEKNVDVVIKAFAELACERPAITLDIVGDGPARESLERLVHRLGMQGRVRMRGFMDRTALGRIYQEYDAFVTASTIETQGIVLLEAMSAGLPIVGVRALAIPELVVEGTDGLLVDPGDGGALAGAMAALLDDAALRERLGSAGRRDVAPHALSNVVTTLEGLYASVLAVRTDQQG